jgi:dTDP-4-amino-4,6-dideoxygalactose transaminase
MQQYASPELSVKEYLANGIPEAQGQHPNELNSGLILSQWKRLKQIKERRREIADLYRQAIAKKSFLNIISEGSHEHLNCFRFYFFSDRREDHLNLLRSKGIDARGSISHNLSTYLKQKGDFQNINLLETKLISLPINSRLTKDDVSIVIEALKGL